MEDELLDYKHNHAMHIENCTNTLIKIFGNILDNPEDTKYRQVKATSNTFKTHVTAVKGGEHLMMLAGFKTQVIDLVKYWMFDSDEHGIKISILRECKTLLERALQTVHEKAERKRREKEEKVQQAQELRNQVLLAIEDDKIDRKIRMETQAVPAAATPAQASTSPPPASPTSK